MGVVHEATYDDGVLKLDQPLPIRNKQRVLIRVESVQDDPSAPQLRRDLARRLDQELGELLVLVGTPAFAINLHRVKRTLLEGHDLLSPHRSESDFDSLLVLVELALACLPWKQLTGSHVKALQRVIRLGCGKRTIGIGDQERARKILNAARIETIPRLDLTSVEESNLKDEDLW